MKSCLGGGWASKWARMNYPWPTAWLAFRLPACLSFSFISWINQELGTLLVESSRPPHLACAWQNECLQSPERCVLLISTHTYITYPGSTWAARGDRVVSSVPIHVTGDPARGWICLAIWASWASRGLSAPLCLSWAPFPLPLTWRCSLWSVTTGPPPTLQLSCV